MSDRERISRTVIKLRTTRRWQVMLDYLMAGLFWGAIPAGLCILASRIWVFPVSEYYVAGGLLATTALGFLVASWFVRLTPLAVANDIDVTLGLRERISSAMALGEGQTASDPFVVTLVHDAAQQIKGLPIKKVYPWGLPPSWKLALPALLIAGAMVLVPQLNLFASQQDRQELKLVQEKGKELVDLAKKTEEQAEQHKSPVMKKQAKEIKRVGEKLQRGNVQKKQALKELQRLKDKLESQAQAQMTEGEKKLAAELGEQLSKLDSTHELGKMMAEGDLKGLSAKLDKLMSDLKEGKLTAGDQQMLDDLAKALENALNSEAANSPDAKEMKQALQQLKQSLQNEQKLRQQMQNALDSLEQDVNKLNDQLNQNNMGQQSQQLNQLMQKLQQQMQQNGMVDPNTLMQMKQALQQTQQAIQNNSQLSQQAQQQMQQQVQKCLQHFDSTQKD